MKARVKESGEVFEIASYATIPMECCDSFGEPLRFCLDEVEILSEENDLKESKNPDYWTRIEHQYAGMAMQGMITRNGYVNYTEEEMAKWCLDVAHDLVEMMKEVRK